MIEELAKSLRIEERGSLDLLRSALLIARLDNENFDLDSYLEKADLLAKKIEESFVESSTQEEKLLILVNQLFDEMGFHGSTLDYHHRSNSYMNEVMDDREGFQSLFLICSLSWPTVLISQFLVSGYLGILWLFIVNRNHRINLKTLNQKNCLSIHLAEKLLAGNKQVESPVLN